VCLVEFAVLRMLCRVDCARSMIRLILPGDQNEGLELLFGRESVLLVGWT
jgi:hypothetical protein